MAVSARGPRSAGVVAHSDHGSPYTSLLDGAYAKQSGIDLSTGSVGDPWDNALAETFFASLEKELPPPGTTRYPRTGADADPLVYRMLLQHQEAALKPPLPHTNRTRTTT